MSTDPTLLANLMCSRLCHDLLSPVGGMTNGIELLADETDPAMREQCIELLAQGARRTATKLRFFRLAFGAAGGFDAELPVKEVRELVDSLAGEAREVKVQWTLNVETLPKAAVKVLLNFALLAIEALPRGGTVTLAVEDSGSTHEIAVRAEGMRIAFDPHVGEAMDGNVAMDDLNAHTAPAELVRLVSAGCGGGVQHARSDDALILGAILPYGAAATHGAHA
ncbi:histidine phosphotransferase family protein [Croceicoccus bisphenolivorans]|uniref:histidine phosphotransferase family protein n=1 Tax=Croceicoccus bisphenolivorans TaxID=1783232 RepID=UPI0008297773|nr:histidine phosphotransferase family protein [Croceicoccus bisphenolivorans]